MTCISWKYFRGVEKHDCALVMHIHPFFGKGLSQGCPFSDAIAVILWPQLLQVSLPCGSLSKPPCEAASEDTFSEGSAMCPVTASGLTLPKREHVGPCPHPPAACCLQHPGLCICWCLHARQVAALWHLQDLASCHLSEPMTLIRQLSPLGNCMPNSTCEESLGSPAAA